MGILVDSFEGIFMVLLIILLAVFAVVGLMVVLGERFAQPVDKKQQAKLSKIGAFACLALIVALIVRELL